MIVIVIILLAAAVWGFMQGFVKQAGSAIGLFLAVVVCRLFGPALASYACSDVAPDSDITFITILSYLALGLLTYLGVWVVMRMARGIIHGVHLGIIDKIGGAIYKVLLWMIVISLVYNLYVCVAPQNAPSKYNSGDVWKIRVLHFAPSVFGSDSARKVIEEVQSTLDIN